MISSYYAVARGHPLGSTPARSGVPGIPDGPGRSGHPFPVELDGVSRQYKTPRVLDTKIALHDYQGPIRQLVITDLGHEEPTFLLTNQLTRSAAKLIGRYAQRMIIENHLADGIDFFHMDALSSAVAGQQKYSRGLRVNFHGVNSIN